MGSKMSFVVCLAVLMLAIVLPLGWAQKNTTSTAQPEQERRSFAQNFAHALNAA